MGHLGVKEKYLLHMQNILKVRSINWKNLSKSETVYKEGQS